MYQTLAALAARRQAGELLAAAERVRDRGCRPQRAGDPLSAAVPGAPPQSEAPIL